MIHPIEMQYWPLLLYFNTLHAVFFISVPLSFLSLVLQTLMPSCLSSLVFFFFLSSTFLLLHSIKNETFIELELISSVFVWSSCFNFDLVSSFFSERSIFGKTVFLVSKQLAFSDFFKHFLFLIDNLLRFFSFSYKIFISSLF